MGTEQTRFDPVFTGKEFVVQYELWRETHQGYSRGDHYSGEGEYDYFIWKGRVTVRNKTDEELQAACLCGVSRERSFRFTSEGVRRLIIVDDIVSDMTEGYADFIAKRIISFFKNDRGKGIPYIELEAPPREELLKAGLVLDEHGQRTLALT